MATFTDGAFCPDLSHDIEDKLRIQTSQYGDGYKQITLDGVNAIDREWSLTWSNRPRFKLLQMRRILTDAKGGSFPFRDPGTGEIFNVSCEEWSITWTRVRRETDDAWGTLSAKFKLWYGLAVSS